MNDNDLLISQMQRGVSAYNAINKRLKRHGNYDVVIAHETFCSGLGALYFSNDLSETPFKILDIVEYPIFSQRSSLTIRELGRRNKYSDLLTYDFAVNIANKFDYCISSSIGQMNSYKDNGCNSKIDLVMNCREISEFSVSQTDILSTMYGFDKSDVILVYPNRAYEHCGLESALQALAMLEDRFKLVVLGEIVESLVEKINNLVMSLRLESRFFVTGMLDPSMILPILSEADVALVLLEPVVDNHRYSLPNRIFDAVATRVPVVSYSGTEVGDFVYNNKIGALASHTDPISLSHAIQYVLEKNIKMKDRLRMIMNECSWESQVLKLIDVIREVKSSEPNILLVAIKDIRRNDRIRRMTRALYKLGARVDVVSRWMPMDSMIVTGVKYHCWEN